jgi:hypothetical protein
MDRCRRMVRRLGFELAIAAITLLGGQPSQAQPQPLTPPSTPRNLIMPLVPYEEGLANLRARDAARPKAVRPRLPGDPPTASSPSAGEAINPSSLMRNY